MEEIERPLRKALAALPTAKKPSTSSEDWDETGRESAVHYRRFVEEVNRSGDREIERALLRG